MPGLTFLIDVACKCGHPTTEMELRLPEGGAVFFSANATGETIPVEPEMRCPSCNNHVIFGRTRAKVEHS